MSEHSKTLVQLVGCTTALCFLIVFSFISLPRFSSPAQRQAFETSAAIPLDPGELKAQAAIVYDPSDGNILFAKNEEVQLPLASLTKLMSADVALQTLNATSTIRVSRQAVATEGDSGLKTGESWSLGSLIKYALLVSSNDGMAAVAESAGSADFVKAMNANAESLGLAQSYFLDPTGLDLTKGVSGAYGSARDVALLTAAFYTEHPAFFESTIQTGAVYGTGKNTLTGKPTATPILDIPGLIGAKTGYTDLAGGNLVAVFDVSLGHPLVAVVLHSTQDGRFDDVRALIAAARASAE